jgi:hypothetical protein
MGANVISMQDFRKVYGQMVAGEISTGRGVPRILDPYGS